MIDSYLNQKAVLKKKINVNEFNEPVFADDQEINCRVDYKRKMVRNKEGQEVISEGSIFTNVEINADDMILFKSSEMIFIAAGPHDDFFGTTLFYEGAF